MGQQAVAVQQQRDLLYLPAVFLRPGSGERQRQPCALLERHNQLRLVAIQFKGTKVGICQPDVLYTGCDDGLPVIADSLQGPLVHFAADGAGSPFAKSALERTAAAGFIGDGFVQRSTGGVGQRQHIQWRGEALQFAAALPGGRGDHGGAVQECQPVDIGPAGPVRAIEELLEADLGLAQENNVNGVNAQVIPGLLHMGPSRDDQQSGQELFQLRREGEKFSGVPGVEAETHDRA